MDMYIEKELHKSLASRTPTVCFVCGSPNSATHALHTRQLSNEPYFPFLEHHEPPIGCEPLKNSGVVNACYVCFSFLLAQWESHERNNTPYSTRLYWLKRVDQQPYSGTDSQNQEDHLHETSSPPVSAISGAANKRASRAPFAVQHDASPLPKRSRADSYEGHLPQDEDTMKADDTRWHDDVIHSVDCGNINAGAAVEDIAVEALDLRSSVSVNREREQERVSSRSSHNSTSNTHSTGGVEILDLSMPDKNATTEVCYVCGDEFQKGLLFPIYAKPIQHNPFFPSLMFHPRPSRSRPMDSTGRVQACKVCHTYLLQQWQAHQSRNTPHGDRDYLLRYDLLRKRHNPVYDTTTFICYACGLEYPSSSLRLLYCRPNAENEPYFPYLENMKAPAGSSPISPQGMVQVCAICYKSIPQKYQVFAAAEKTSSLQLQQRTSPHRIIKSPVDVTCRSAAESSSRDAAHSEGNRLSPELSCYVCHRLTRTEAMNLLRCYPETRNEAPRSAVDHVMHFPFLKTLPTPAGLSYFDSHSRTLVCVDCYNHFSHQWHVFESDALALELRHYTLPPLAHQRVPKVADVLKDDNPVASSSPSPLELTSGISSAGTVHVILPFRNAVNERQQRSSPVSPGPSNNGQRHLTKVMYSPVRRTASNPASATANAAIINANPAVGQSADRRSASSLSNRTTPGSGVTQVSVSTAIPADGRKDSPIPSAPVAASESSIYCYLCGMNSTRTFAHWLPSAPSGDLSGAYFPFIVNYSPCSQSESLREDGSALVCSFCFHMVHSQWKQYEDAPIAKSLLPQTRVYNTHDYTCYVCGIATYRKRVRALPVKDFPFLKQHRQPRNSISIEKGQFVVVCLDCFESLRSQSLEYERWGLPVEKRQYNWMAIPPPPEDSNNLSTPLERILVMEQQKRNREIAAAATTACPGSTAITSLSGTVSTMKTPLSISNKITTDIRRGNSSVTADMSLQCNAKRSTSTESSAAGDASKEPQGCPAAEEVDNNAIGRKDSSRGLPESTKYRSLADK